MNIFATSKGLQKGHRITQFVSISRTYLDSISGGCALRCCPCVLREKSLIGMRVILIRIRPLGLSTSKLTSAELVLRTSHFQSIGEHMLMLMLEAKSTLYVP